MYTYRKFLAIIILSACFLCLFSCAPTQRAESLELLEFPAEFNAEGERNGVAFAASLTIGSRREDGTRSGKIAFSSPAAFSGLCVRTDCGVWEAELDGIKISGRSAEALGAPLAPFMQKNNAVSAELTESTEGELRTLITVPAVGGCFEFLIDGKSGYPVLLRERNDAGETVMEFKISEYIIIEEN